MSFSCKDCLDCVKKEQSILFYCVNKDFCGLPILGTVPPHRAPDGCPLMDEPEDESYPE